MKKDIEMKENQLLKVLAETIKEMCLVPLEEIEMTEEERLSIVGSEIEGHSPHEDVTREERTGSEKEKTTR